MIDTIRIKSPTMDKDLCEAHRESIKARLDGMDHALHLRSIEMDRRLDGLNALRAEVVSDRAQFLKIEAYEIKHAVLSGVVGELKESIGKVKTAAAVWIISIGIVLGVLDFVWRVLAK